MLLGFGLGLVVAAVVYVRGSGVDVSVPQPSETAASTSATAPKEEPKSAVAQPRASAPQEKRFDFYDILPHYEVVVPEVETPTANEPAARANPIEQPGRYVVQAGSFSAFADADRLQAKLALLGIESRVQRVTIDDDVFHRVRIGPITDLGQLNRVRRQLADAGVESMLMKVRE